jgi:OmpA-OmpF porin, OOP family
MLNKLFLILILLFSFTVYSQSKRVFLFEGDKLFAKQDYINAVAQYQNALSDSIENTSRVIPYGTDITNQKLPKTKIKADTNLTVTLEQYLNHQIADCYFKLFDYPRSEKHYKITTEINAYPNDRFYYAQSLMNNQKYDLAISEFEKYIGSQQSNEELSAAAQVAMTGCFFAIDDQKAPKITTVKAADSLVFNSGTTAFAPTYFGSKNKLIFSSARPGGVILNEKQNSAYLLDLYWTEEIDGKWSSPRNFGRPLNSAQHDAAGILQNNIIYYVRWNDLKPNDQFVHMARMVDLKFYESYRLDTLVNLPGYKSIHPFVSLDGTKLYFSSNRPGGFGGMDIWKVDLNEQGLPSAAPQNLGPLVNSDRDEGTPFFHEVSSTLFFSSNGHASMGGLDIFKSFYNRDISSFQTPKNMGSPINSSYDDAYLIVDSKLDRGFFSSDREPCEGGHCFDIFEVKNEPIVIKISGYSYDKKTEEILPNCKLTFKDVHGEMNPIVLRTDLNGYYDTILEYGIEIFIKAQKAGYFADASSVDTRSITESTSITRDFYLDLIPQGDIEIDGIEYDFNSANLRPESKEKLDKLFEFLELNNNLAVEINSHTDTRGSDIYNLDLSQRRAKSCVDYLISKGISAERLISKGYGETEPNVLKKDKKPVLDSKGKEILITDAYIDSKPTKDEREALHQKNRRTSFRVLKSDL